MFNELCDKCRRPVPLYDDAVALETMVYESRLPNAWERVMYGARHLFRNEHCEGSPSRARYFYGELSRDTRGYRWSTLHQLPLRQARAKLVKLYRAGLVRPFEEY